MTSTPTIQSLAARTGNVTPKNNALPSSRPVETKDENRLLTTKQAAAYTTYSPHGLENLRCAGKGPAFIKVRGGAVAYRLADLLAWQEQHRVATLDQQ